MRADFLNGTPTRTGNKIFPLILAFLRANTRKDLTLHARSSLLKAHFLKEETASFLTEWAGVAGKLMAVWNASMFS